MSEQKGQDEPLVNAPLAPGLARILGVTALFLGGVAVCGKIGAYNDEFQEQKSRAREINHYALSAHTFPVREALYIPGNADLSEPRYRSPSLQSRLDVLRTLDASDGHSNGIISVFTPAQVDSISGYPGLDTPALQWVRAIAVQSPYPMARDSLDK